MKHTIMHIQKNSTILVWLSGHAGWVIYTVYFYIGFFKGADHPDESNA